MDFYLLSERVSFLLGPPQKGQRARYQERLTSSWRLTEARLPLVIHVIM